MRPIAAVFVALAAAAQVQTPPPDEAVREFTGGQWASLQARFSEQLKALLPVEKLAQMDALRPCTVEGPPLMQSAPKGTTMYVYTLVCRPQKVGLRLTGDAAGKLHGIFIGPPPEAATGLAVESGNLKLPAKLTLPEGDGPFPAVVFVHGSGPQDMDQTVGPNKTFAELAEALARRGIASLRYTKRTKQYPGVLPPGFTVREETIDDAVNAVRLLQKSPRVNAKRVFVVGHSLGGHAAPRIAAAEPSVAGVVILAGHTRPVLTLIDEQIAYLGAPPEQAARIKAVFSGAYLDDERANPPAETLRKLTIPALVLQGERDYQVTMQDFAGWKAAARPGIQYRSYPELNHLFQPGEGKSTPAEYQKAVPFSAVAAGDIAGWVLGVGR